MVHENNGQQNLERVLLALSSSPRFGKGLPVHGSANAGFSAINPTNLLTGVLECFQAQCRPSSDQKSDSYLSVCWQGERLPPAHRQAGNFPVEKQSKHFRSQAEATHFDN